MFAYVFALLERVKAETKGVTALEYGLLAGLIAVVIIGGATVLGTNVNKLFGNIATTMSNV
jgi:pilus assembly protein Flp/PilA